MNPIRRELLNGLLVLVVASLLSVAFAAFQVSFNALLWTLILLGMAVAVGGYVVFEFVLSTEKREMKTEQRELEWLKRVGNPARLEMGTSVVTMLIDTLRSMKPGTGDYTVMVYVDRDGGSARRTNRDETNEQIYRTILEQLKRGTIREYKRLICFDHDVLANDPELKSGILRVGEGPGTIRWSMGEHCHLMLETKGCSVYVAPVVLRGGVLSLLGPDKVYMTVDTVDQETGASTSAGGIIFSDPPNGELIEQFRQIERATERRMVAVQKIRFPEDTDAAPQKAVR